MENVWCLTGQIRYIYYMTNFSQELGILIMMCYVEIQGHGVSENDVEMTNNFCFRSKFGQDKD